MQQRSRDSQTAHDGVTTILESITDAFISMDRDFRVTYVNHAAETVLAKQRQEFLGKSLWESFPEAVGSRFRLVYEESLARNTSAHFETFFPPFKRWFKVYVYPSAVGLSVRFTDITESKQTEDVLRFLTQVGRPPKGEDFFPALARYLARTLEVDYVCIDRLQEGSLAAQTIAVYFDGHFQDNVSYTLKDTPCGDVVAKTVCCFPKEVRHLFPKDVVLQEMKAESYVGVTLCSGQGQPIGLIAVLGRKPLANPPAAVSLLQLVAGRAAPELERQQAEEALQKANALLEQRVVARTADLQGALQTLQAEVLERVAAEHHLQMGEDRYRSLITASAQIVWSTNAQGGVVDDMPTWRAFTGQTFDEIKGVGWANALHPEDRDRVQAAWTQAVQSRGLYEVEYRIREVSGGYRLFAVRGVPVLEVDGSIREWVGTCTDITERKEEEKRRAVTTALLELFAHKTSSKDYLDSVVQFLRDWTGGQALGIRVIDKLENAPYQASVGFGPEFIQLEDQIRLKTDACFCVRALSQAVEDQERHLLTPHGSFHCNHYADFIGQLPPGQQARYRCTCPKFGLASVVIVPVRHRGRILGAIHLADPRPRWFSPAMVEFLEAISPLIGEAITRFHDEAELSQHRDHLAELVQKRTSELESANATLQKEITERTAAQAALARSQSLLTAIFNSMTDAVIFSDSQRRVGSTNPSARELFGYAAGELEGQSAEICYVRNSDFQELVQSRFHPGVVPSLTPFEMWYRRKDGTRFLGETVGNPVKDEQGNVLGFVSIHRDITERKRAERKLAWLASFPELNPHPVVEVDLDSGTVVYLNPTSRTLFPDLESKGLAHPWLAGLLHRSEASRLTGTVCLGSEIQVGKAWYAQSFCFVPGGQRLRVYSLDITERKRAEEALREARDDLELRVEERTAELKKAVDELRASVFVHQQTELALTESEERYHKLFEFAPVGIGVADFDGNVLGFNRTLCGLMGLTPEEAKATKLPMLYEQPKDLLRMLRQLHKTGSVRNWEVRKKRKDGSVFTALMHLEQIRIGPKPAVLVILEDITRQKLGAKRAEGIKALLELFVTNQTGKEYLDSVVKLLRGWCDCTALGIRLLEKDGHLPYAARAGFSREFVKQENRLCLDTGQCGCLRVLRGEALPPDSPHFSASGTFLCNSLRDCGRLVPGTAQEESQVACLLANYASIASVAIRYRGELRGAIHLADMTEGKFPAETIEFLETAAPLIGEAVHRFKLEQSLLDSEARFRSMFESHSAILLLLNPQTGRLVDANPAAAAFYGYSREQLLDMRIEELNTLPPEMAAAKRQRALDVRQNFFISVHRLAGGEVRTVEVHSSAVQVGGQPLLFSIIHDITERLLLQKQVLEISEAERQRVGRDLHDSLGGTLAGAALMGKALAKTLRAQAIPEAALAEEVVQCLNQSIIETRAIAHGLCPVELTRTGLHSGLAEFAANISRQAGVSCQWRVDAGTEVDDAFVAAHLFRIVQESVHNALRHGQARNIAIAMTRKGELVSLEIRDDGSGLPNDLSVVKGLGMRTMKFRADIIGAEFSVRRGERGGTVVNCLAPALKLSAAQKTKPCP